MRSWCLPSGALLLGLVALAGCDGGGSAYVTRFPHWDFERYERLAVLPGKATTRAALRDARVLSDRITTLLTQNGTFTVLSRSELSDVLKEQDLSRLVDVADADTAVPEGMLKIAQALVSTCITDYKLIADREKRTVPRYARDRRGRILLDRAGRPIVAGHDVLWIYKHGAQVEGSVRVTDTATGKVLVSHTARVEPRPRVGHGRPPSTSPEEMAAEAVRELAVEFYKTVAPTRMEVKLKGDMLIIATDYFDGEYDKTKKLDRSLEVFLVVVRDLPPECERNDFRVAIAEEEGHANLFEEHLTWSSSFGREGVAYRVPLATLTATGGEKFVAKLYSENDPEPILKRDFKLEKPKDK